MSSHRICLLGNGSLLNRGCQAILLGTQSILAEVFPHASLEYLPFCQHNFNSRTLTISADQQINMQLQVLPSVSPFQKHSIQWLLRQGLSYISRKLGPHNLAYLAFNNLQKTLRCQVHDAYAAMQIGGDNFSFDYGFPLLHATINKALHKEHVPTVIWGASVGPFSTSRLDAKWMIEHLRRYSDLILVREPLSLNYMHKVGLHNKTFLMADPAFCMKPTIPSQDLTKFLPSNGVLGINLSPLMSRYLKTSQSLLAWTKYAASLIYDIYKTFDRFILFIPHVMQSGNSDYEFMINCIKMAKIPSNTYSILPPFVSAPELKYIISQLDLLIASRTHATISSFSSLVPTISISYSMKSYGLNMQIFRHTNYVIDVNSLTSQNLIKKIAETLGDSTNIRSELSDKIPAIQKLAFEGGIIMKYFLSRS